MRLAIVALVAACSSQGNDGPPSQRPPESALVATTPNEDVDVLFVIDDSTNTLDMQIALKAAFPTFLAELASLPTGLPNLHIGVITSDVGALGALDAAPGPAIGSGPGSCSGTGRGGNLVTNGATSLSGSYISNVENADGSRSVNYTGNMDAVFSHIASVGSNGCGFEQPAHAAQRALDNNPANLGFLRPNANLVVIVLADEDDCSMAHSTLTGADTATLGPLQSFRCTRFGITCDEGGATSEQMNQVGVKGGCHSNESSPYLMSLASYTTFFKGLKDDPRLVMFGAIVGDRMPIEVELRTAPGGGTPIPALAHACVWQESTGTNAADPAVRIAELTESFSRGTVTSVCSDNLTGPTGLLARHIRTMVGDSCVPTAIATPAACQAYDTLSDGSETALPSCTDTVTTDCFELVADAGCSQGARLHVERSTTPPADTMVSLRCRG